MSERAGGEAIRVRGLVQGVGFRPTVWRLAQAHGLSGEVRNDGEGVLIRLWGDTRARERFCAELRAQCPPLARIDSLERSALAEAAPAGPFRIVASGGGAVRTAVVPDAATCPACRRELFDPADRRWRYPFINCTHCGPRLSIVERIPYDRVNTSMAAFAMCPDCAAEYADPGDRRFHAQPNACGVCGPQVWLEDAGGWRLDPAELGGIDAIAAASRLLAQGAIVALKGIGGFHLACDAGDPQAVARLRRRKGRYAKPFALMARDLAVIGRYAEVGAAEAALLASPAAPIVLLRAGGPQAVAAAVAPGQDTLGFMLPYSPLHHLLLADWERPLVMTSGNRSEEPQCIANDEATERLAGLADYRLLHDRAIVNRVDDSVLRLLDGAPQLLRRARGYAPVPLPLPEGFAAAAPLLALGGELKVTICLVQDGQAILSQHLGDLEEARTAREYERTFNLYLALYRHAPTALAVDAHPGYRSTLTGRAWAARAGLPLVTVQHHHAHIASVLADNGWPLAGGRVLGIALDGLGYGPDGSFWGGELLVAEYLSFERVGWLAPVAMPGGERAVREPWRNTYAQLRTHLGWDRVQAAYPDLELVRWLAGQPLAVCDRMIERGLNAPPTSSCGRLFDAVAGAVGLCRDGIRYEGQAAIELEVLADRAPRGGPGYPFALAEDARGCLLIDPTPMWSALLADLAVDAVPAVVAARFHDGLAAAVVTAAEQLASRHGLAAAALSGGVFQNKRLLEAVAVGLRRSGLQVLVHGKVPANDGGLSLGQAAVAAARLLSGDTNRDRP
ncbi:(NiFe) hydrogenase maturation protein HypF [Thioflavicoccus mobilis 8321]|uniref:Carbamoyltransferase HypF n=1 Tax=Thioflavicoccus mobilis 8321 TaxID=765912 RepID=L0GY24_9GAMM|nr:carbamoyltransferase HypF [Thioflavicoccus mobilis]AGA90722.1 (NiFe) hydrogenase maturation protein HypF [Thioflavicoccus mobilis 8321]